jgi:hypothetical protein
MTLGEGLQLAGGICEFLGLIAIMMGISDTRRAFTNRPSLVSRVFSPFRRLVAGLFRRDAVVHPGVAEARVQLPALTARGTGRVGWETLAPEQVIRRLQELVDRHEDRLEQLAEHTDTERAEREKQFQAERTEREMLHRDLEQRITLAAAGGLRLESLGAAAFTAGVVLTTWGAMV